MTKERCPNCGWETGKLYMHLETCQHVPGNLDEVFLNGGLNLTQMANKYRVSASFIRYQIRRMGVSDEQIHEHLREINENGWGGRLPDTKEGAITIEPDEQCGRCGIVLWNDPAYIPNEWLAHAHWHINFGGCCHYCATHEMGVDWCRNLTLVPLTTDSNLL